VGAIWDVVVTLVSSSAVTTGVVFEFAVIIIVGSVTKKRGNNLGATSAPIFVLSVVTSVTVVMLGLGLGLVVVVVEEVVVVVDDDVDVVTISFVSLIRSLTLFAKDDSGSGANVGKSILTCELLSDVSEAVAEAGVVVAVAVGIGAPTTSLSSKLSSSKSASKLLDGVVLPPPAPPRFPDRTLLSRPGPATRITCAIMRLTIESIS